MSDKISITPQEPIVPEKDAFVLELQRLLACYQLATPEEKRIVWSALNKYVHFI